MQNFVLRFKAELLMDFVHIYKSYSPLYGRAIEEIGFVH